MRPEVAVELFEAARAVGVLERGHFLEQVGMAADGALPELDQAAGHDIRAFDRDADRQGAVRGAEVIVRAVLHALAAVHVHGVVDHHAQPFGRLLLHDGGDHRRLVAVIDAGAGETARGVEQIGGRGHAAEPLLDRRKAADRLMELLADAGIGAGRVRGEGGAGRRQRRQRNAAPGRERAHQHLPAFAHLRDAADDVVERDEDIATAGRAVLERLQRRQMPAADLDAGQIGRHQRDRDADVVAVADQVIGIVELERKTDQGRDRRQRDVALIPVEPDAEHLAPLPGAAADHA